jgi:hypothetical protein
LAVLQTAHHIKRARVLIPSYLFLMIALIKIIVCSMIYFQCVSVEELDTIKNANQRLTDWH